MKSFKETVVAKWMNWLFIKTGGIKVEETGGYRRAYIHLKTLPLIPRFLSRIYVTIRIFEQNREMAKQRRRLMILSGITEPTSKDYRNYGRTEYLVWLTEDEKRTRLKELEETSSGDRRAQVFGIPDAIDRLSERYKDDLKTWQEKFKE